MPGYKPPPSTQTQLPDVGMNIGPGLTAAQRAAQRAPTATPTVAPTVAPTATPTVTGLPVKQIIEDNQSQQLRYAGESVQPYIDAADRKAKAADAAKRLERDQALLGRQRQMLEDARRVKANQAQQDDILQRYLSTPMTRPQDVSQSTMKVKPPGGSGAPE